MTSNRSDGFVKIKQDQAYINLMAKVMKGIDVPSKKKRKQRAKETKPRQHKEATLLSQIKQELKLMEFYRQITWWDRYNSGRINNGFSWITLCREGTADLAVYLNDGKIWFIETKADGKQTDAQIMFSEVMCSYYWFIQRFNK